MSDQLQLMLSNLQNQINAMSNLVSQPSPAPVSPQPQQLQGITQMQPDILSMIKTVVQSEFAKHGLGQNAQAIKQQNSLAAGAANQNQNQPQQQQQPMIPPQASQIGMLLPIIGAAYTTDQQEWLSQPQNLLGIPGFLMSNDGKALLNMALESYQQFCGGKTKSDA